MSYDLTIRFDDAATQCAEFSRIERFFEAYPGVRREDWDVWVYEPNSSVHVAVSLAAGDETDLHTVSSVDISIPYPYLPASGDSALRLCFALADHLGWRVFDEQIGDYVSPDGTAALLSEQADFASAANSALRGATWADRWASAAKQQSVLFLFLTLCLGAAGALAIIVPLGVREDNMATAFFWTGLPLALIIFTIKIAIDAWLRRQRKRRPS